MTDIVDLEKYFSEKFASLEAQDARVDKQIESGGSVGYDMCIALLKRMQVHFELALVVSKTYGNNEVAELLTSNEQFYNNVSNYISKEAKNAKVK